MTSGGPLVRAGRALGGRFTPPGDKSITHRAILFGLLAEGVTVVHGANRGADCARTLGAAALLGAGVDSGLSGEIPLVLVGSGGALVAPGAPLDCGNSGTTMRLLAGLLAAQPYSSELFGDASLSRRPMDRVMEPLARMGARFESAPGGRPPLRVHGAELHGIEYDSPVASAQVATALLLAGLFAQGETRVSVPGPARDHTERMLPAFGVGLDVRPLPGGGRSVGVRRARLVGCEVTVPGDASAAAFFLCAAAAEPGARVTAAGMTLNSTRTGLLGVLESMGAGVERANERTIAGEPVGDVTVTGPSGLRAVEIAPALVPTLVDELPAWAIAASAAQGVSRVTGAGELRVKESDRVAAVVRNLGVLGLAARELSDGFEIEGGRPRGGRVEAGLDHRIVMAFAALGARCAEPVTFDDVSSVATSYPAFWDDLASLGAAVEFEAA